MSKPLICEYCKKEFDCGCGLLEVHTSDKGVCETCKQFLISEEDTL